MPRRPTKDPSFIKLQENIDLESFVSSVKGSFQDTDDPRQINKTKYPFWFLMLLLLCGYLSGANNVSDLTIYAQLNIEWLNTLVGETFEAPSYDTLWWLLARLTPATFKQLLQKWFAQIPQDCCNQLLAVDGKRVRGVSRDGNLVHLVELFAVNQRLVLAQEKVPDKSSEPKVLDPLLQGIDVRGAILSMDALFACAKHAQKVIDHEADYLIGLKGNQSHFHAEVMNFFKQARYVDYEGTNVEQWDCEQERGHGRIEKRSVRICSALDWLPQLKLWPELKTIIEVESKRSVNGETSTELRYYFSSRKAKAKSFGDWVRDHWSIENRLHWILDVIFKEDSSQADAGFIAENMAFFRRLSMNLVKTADPKRGLSDARRFCTYEPKYLRGILGAIFTGI